MEYNCTIIGILLEYYVSGDGNLMFLMGLLHQATGLLHRDSHRHCHPLQAITLW